MRYAAELSWPQIEALDREHTVILMPIASVEQHGRHLPVGTDYLLMLKLVEALIGFRLDGYEGLILPTIQFGLNTEHSLFPGTISLQRGSIEDILRQQADSFVRHGFKNYIVLNSHGGNFDMVDSFIRTFRIASGSRMINIDYFRGKVFEDHRELFENAVGLDVHAGEFETSLMMHLYPDLVDMDHTTEELAECNLSSRQLPYGWLTHELSRSGVIGDATYANKGKGKALFELIVNYVFRTIKDFCKTP